MNNQRKISLVYYLQMIGALLGIPLIFAVIISYVGKYNSFSSWRKDIAYAHFVWQIKTFWIWCLLFIPFLYSTIYYDNTVSLFSSFSLLSSVIWMFHRATRGYAAFKKGVLPIPLSKCLLNRLAN